MELGFKIVKSAPVWAGFVAHPHPTGIHFELNCVGLRHAIVQINQYYVLNLEI